MANREPARSTSGSRNLVGQFVSGLTFSRLTLTIIVANLICLAIVFVGSLSMTQYRDGLIAAKLEGVRAQAQVIADIMAQVAADDTACENLDEFQDGQSSGCRVALQEDNVNLVFSRVWDSFEGRVRVFNAPSSFENLSISDARDLLLEDVVLRKDEFDVTTLPDIEEEGFTLKKLNLSIEQLVIDIWPAAGFRKDAQNRTVERELTEAFSLAPQSKQRGIASVRYNEEGELVASVSVPIRKVQAIYGVVTAEIGGIQDLVDEARVAILPIFAIALVAIFLSSLLLTILIAQPIRQLAIAADRVREGIAVAGRVRIPDFSTRRDEIGELSASLRAMTRVIYARIEAIESFAADVSHELKNPLTSIRSAAETLSIAKTPEAQEKLMVVIQKDVIRMDRLITDISNASRLDAELARETREIVELEKLLNDIIEVYATTRKEGRASVKLESRISSVLAGNEIYVLGSPTALGQVFRNLIDNAISFSPEDQPVVVRLVITDQPARLGTPGELVQISVEDNGPGIPEESLESIFKRFYTERAPGTAFGNNSGLGLAISRQIIESHGGEVWAENREDEEGNRQGALFHVTIPLRH